MNRVVAASALDEGSVGCELGVHAAALLEQTGDAASAVQTGVLLHMILAESF